MTSLVVRVTPRGGRDAVEGWMRDASGQILLKVRIAAPPADGEANAAVIALIAKSLRVPRSAVRIASGASSRIKRLDVSDVSDAQMRAAFGEPDASVEGTHRRG